jgi:endo-1,4-beta-mannosidase
MNSQSEFLLGVNYWPPRAFTRMWAEFDAAQTDRDFAAIAGIGLRLVRFFLFWTDFQPQPDRIDPRQLAHLDAVFAAAQAHGLLVMPTLFVGHMSGPNWLPAWAMSDEPNNRPMAYIVDGAESPAKPRDMYGADALVAEAQALLVRTVVRRYASHPALWGWDLFNEINFVQIPERMAGERWLARMAGEVHALDAGHPVTAGFVPAPEDAGRGFARSGHRFVDVASEHAYPLYDGRSAGPYDAEYVGRAIEETRAAAGKPALLAEFGLSINPEPGEGEVMRRAGGARVPVRLADEPRAGEFVRRVLPIARDAGALGALIWCFSDYDPALYDGIALSGWPHERYFGIFGASGRLKATGEAMREFARTL